MDDSLYRAFAEVEDRHWWFVARRAIVLRLIDRWVPAGSTVVDVGCGTGGFIDALQSTHNVRGIDPAPPALEACRARGLGAVLQGTAADRASWGALPVDAVTLLDVIEHVDDDVAVLHEAAMAVVSSGVVIVTVPAYQWLWSHHDELNHHRRRYTASRLRAAHRKAGLEPIQSGYFNSVLFPLAVMQRAASGLGIGGRPLAIPRPFLNRLFCRILSSEAPRLGRGVSGFAFGLSAFCVSRPRSDASEAGRPSGP
jgi:SAM-dependent methyltransferase